jgi:hypothetical protein
VPKPHCFRLLLDQTAAVSSSTTSRWPTAQNRGSIGHSLTAHLAGDERVRRAGPLVRCGGRPAGESAGGDRTPIDQRCLTRTLVCDCGVTRVLEICRPTRGSVELDASESGAHHPSGRHVGRASAISKRGRWPLVNGAMVDRRSSAGIRGIWRDPAVTDENRSLRHCVTGRGAWRASGLTVTCRRQPRFELVNDYLGLARNAATASCTVG